MKKIILFVAVLVALAAFSVLPKKSYAETQTKFPALIQRMIDKFKLNSGEVQQVMEEEQTQRQQEMKSRREAKLEEAVKAGVIRAEQKTALLNKETEWQQKEEQLRQEIQQWREESGIDFLKLAPYGIGFDNWGYGGRGFGKGHGLGGF